MSLRREEAELRRALELSTQQVQELARLPPQSLSSSSTTHSRDLELRPVHPSIYNTPHHTPQDRMPYAFPILSPSPPGDAELAHVLGLTPSQPPGNHGDFPIETPASNINTFSSAVTNDTPSSVINTFPRTLQTPLPERTATRVEVVMPRRDMRHSSVDPIDSLRDGASPPPREDLVLGDASRSSGPSTNGPNASVSGSSAPDADLGRRSARQRENKEKEDEQKRKEAAAKEERKRKRAEEKARQQAEESERRDDDDYRPGRPEKKKRAERKKPSQTKSSQQKSSQAKSVRSSQKSVASSQEESASASTKSHAETSNLPTVAEEPASSNVSAASNASNKRAPKNKSPKKASGKQKSTPVAPPTDSPDEPIGPSPLAEKPAESCAEVPSSPPSEPPPSPAKSPAKSPVKSPAKSSAPPPKSPVKDVTSTPSPAPPTTPAPRLPLQPARSTPGSAGSARGTPVNWRTARNDLPTVLAKFPGAKRTGMSRRTRIASLHTSIGPGVKALPPPPPKTRKKVESEDEDSDTEGKVKVGSREWLMMED